MVHMALELTIDFKQTLTKISMIIILPVPLILKWFDIGKHWSEGRSSQSPLNKAINPSLETCPWQSLTNFLHVSLHGKFVEYAVEHFGIWTEQDIRVENDEQFLNLLCMLVIKLDSLSCSLPLLSDTL